MAEPRQRKRFVFDIPVLVVVATAGIGIMSCVSLGSRVNEAQALCLVAAALAFGLLSVALWRR